MSEGWSYWGIARFPRTVAAVGLIGVYATAAKIIQSSVEGYIRLSLFSGNPISVVTGILQIISVLILYDIWSLLTSDRWIRLAGIGAAFFLCFSIGAGPFPNYPDVLAVYAKMALDSLLFLLPLAVMRLQWRRVLGHSELTEPRVPSQTVSDQDALGSGSTVFDRVVRALVKRSLDSETAARWGMFIMIALVLIGGGASVGFWFQSQESRVRDLTEARGQLSRLAVTLDAAIAETKNQDIVNDWANISKGLKATLATTSNSEDLYQKLLTEVQIQEKTSWQDIAIRATIAILTLFLVQIFFSVFRYNRSLSSLLAAKAEALELSKDDPEAVHRLRLQVASVITSSQPTFSAGPRTPLDGLVEAATTLASKGKSTPK